MFISLLKTCFIELLTLFSSFHKLSDKFGKNAVKMVSVAAVVCAPPTKRRKTSSLRKFEKSQAELLGPVPHTLPDSLRGKFVADFLKTINNIFTGVSEKT